MEFQEIPTFPVAKCDSFPIYWEGSRCARRYWDCVAIGFVGVDNPLLPQVSGFRETVPRCDAFF